MDTPRKERKVYVRFDEETYKTLKSLSSRKAVGVSTIVREAVEEFLNVYDVKDLLRKVKDTTEDLKTITRSLDEYRLPEIASELKEVTYQLKALKEEIQRLEKLLEVNLFWGALAVELIKARLFNVQALRKEEYETYKKLWEAVHEKADERVESLVGKKVWNRRFNPGK